jgi:hypothetical protein
MIRTYGSCMNYQKHYELLIERARSRILEGYVEKHHIVPKCLGGDDSKDNLVQLTPEEHFVAHVLLVKIFPKEKNLIIAVQKMCQGHKGRRSRKLYGWLRERYSKRISELQSGEGNSQFGTKWIHRGLENKRILKSDPVPDGWEIGRKLKTPSIKLRSCLHCNSEFQVSPFSPSQKYCSRSCSMTASPRGFVKEFKQ